MIEFIILGIVQGVSEFLPISSSGHLIIFKEFFNLDADIVFDVFLHLATFLAILIFYYKDILNLIIAFFGKKDKNHTVFKIIIASLPAIVAGLLLGDYLELFRSPHVVATTLILVAIFMYFADKKRKSENFVVKKNISYKDAFLIGLSQSLALIPGTSRSGITLATSFILGEKKEEAIKFSFLIALPAIFGAFLLEFLKLPDKSILLSYNYTIAFLFSLLTGIFSIKLLVNLLNRYSFTPFIIYRIILALVVIILINTNVLR